MGDCAEMKDLKQILPWDKFLWSCQILPVHNSITINRRVRDRGLYTQDYSGLAFGPLSRTTAYWLESTRKTDWRLQVLSFEHSSLCKQLLTLSAFKRFTQYAQQRQMSKITRHSSNFGIKSFNSNKYKFLIMSISKHLLILLLVQVVRWTYL